MVWTLPQTPGNQHSKKAQTGRGGKLGTGSTETEMREERMQAVSGNGGARTK